LPGDNPAKTRKVVEELLGTGLPGFEKDLQKLLKSLPEGSSAPQPAPFTPPASKAIMAGVRKYTEIPVPILAIFALPDAEWRDDTDTGVQAKAFEAGVPSARVIRMPGANHYEFRSNEADVLREITAFVKTLPR
jgi:non-heme chloroperoxidase